MDGRQRMEASWDRCDLARRLCRVLDIAAKSVERLGSTGYTDPIEPANSLPSEKLIAETAVLLVAISAVPAAEPIADRADRLARALTPHARSARMRLGLCLRPALAWDYGLAHICLQRLGYADAAFDRLLQRSVRAQASGGRERVPHRMLEIEWMRRMASGDRPADAPERSPALLQSVLNNPMDLFGGTRDDVYAFTHALMYIADFNGRPVPLPRARTTVLAEAAAGLARSLDEEDYDVGGELLLAWPLTGAFWDPAAAFGFRVLADVEDQVGFLPAAATRLDRMNAMAGEARRDYLTATAYHTAYVMGLLCAAALRHGRALPRRIPTANAVPGSAAAVLPFLDDGGRRRHWQDTLDRLTVPERDAISGFLLTIALHRRVAANDFTAVAELLAKAVSLGLADTPAIVQAAELLDRLTLLSVHEHRPAPGAERCDGLHGGGVGDRPAHAAPSSPRAAADQHLGM
jgi:hypothetical protein